MERTDIWFDLHIGQIVTDDNGIRRYLSANISKQQLTATIPIKQASAYREELHKRLDDAINKIDNAKYEAIPYGPYKAKRCK